MVLPASGSSLVLASASPRRQDILRSLGVRFRVVPADIDEQRLADEDPAGMVLRLARDKAGTVAGTQPAGTLVLGADTVVTLGDEIFGKPRDEADALAMLGCLSGRTHVVYTGVALVSAAGLGESVSRTEVRFREIGPDEARRYWHSGEPAGKAGAYAIQGCGGMFVESIMGSYSGVVGLPVFETAALLQAAGVELMPGAQQQT